MHISRFNVVTMYHLGDCPTEDANVLLVAHRNKWRDQIRSDNIACLQTAACSSIWNDASVLDI